MDLIIYLFDNGVNYIIASVPLIVLYMQRKIFKMEYKCIGSSLVFNLVVSIFFWIKIKDLGLVLYQSIPYVLSYIYIWIGCKREKNKGN